MSFRDIPSDVIIFASFYIDDLVRISKVVIVKRNLLCNEISSVFIKNVHTTLSAKQETVKYIQL